MSNEGIKQKIFVALSGGVDSAVTAALLKEQGYSVTGVYMKNWSGDDYGIQADCPWEKDMEDAKAVCEHLGIEFRSYNFEKQYREKVVEYFFSEYEKGRTPNPDVMCNKEIKFDLFLEKAISDGADKIATGHYARVIENKGQFELLKGVDPNKDQTYFLYNLTQEQLARTLFPIGGLLKDEVRELARKFKLPNADKPDSQGICFIGEIDIFEYLRARLPIKKGEIIDIDSHEVVGNHDGVSFYTIGQREGLGIGGQEIPYFIVTKDIKNNILYVGHGNEHKEMMHDEVQLENIHLISKSYTSVLSEEISASVRYRQKPVLGKFSLRDMKFSFNEDVRAVTSGQSIVLFKEDVCLGGGIIS